MYREDGCGSLEVVVIGDLFGGGILAFGGFLLLASTFIAVAAGFFGVAFGSGKGCHCCCG